MENQNGEREVLALLAPVQRRQRRRAVLQLAARGLLVGAIVAVALGLLNLEILMGRAWLGFSSWSVHWVVVAGLASAALLAGPLWGVWAASRGKPDWLAAAAAVDSYYKLEDRTVSALGFFHKSDRSLMEEMQIADCLGRLAQVDPSLVARLGLPKPMLAALSTAGLAVVIVISSIAVSLTPETPSATVEESTAPAPKAKRLANVAAVKQPSAEDLGWQAAPPGEISVGRAIRFTGTLQEVVSGRQPESIDSDQMPGRDSVSETGRHGPIVIQSERLPIEHRQTIRRYFEAVNIGQRHLGVQ